MHPIERPPQRFLKSFRGWKNGSFDEPHLPSKSSQNPNEKKHKRFPGEAHLLQQITSTYEGVVGFNESVPADLDAQLQAMNEGLSAHISQAISTRDDLRKTAVHIAPYLRQRDRAHFLFNAERMSYEDAAVTTVASVLHGSLVGSLIDSIATINTMSALVLQEYPDAASAEISAILKRSTQPNDFMANSHGKYDDGLKIAMGRFDENGEDLVVYNPSFFTFVETPKGLSIELDADRLYDIREELKLSDPPQTDEIHCPAVYSPLIDKLWNGTIDIYERTDAFSSILNK